MPARIPPKSIRAPLAVMVIVIGGFLLAALFLPHKSPAQRIAFESKRDGSFEIYLMDADGADPVRVTHHPATDANPNWSADGKYIFFQSDRDGDLEIFRMDADGSNVI